MTDTMKLAIRKAISTITSAEDLWDKFVNVESSILTADCLKSTEAPEALNETGTEYGKLVLGEDIGQIGFVATLYSDTCLLSLADDANTEWYTYEAAAKPEVLDRLSLLDELADHCSGLASSSDNEEGTPMTAMMFSVWRREDADTTPRGFGNKPTYSIDRPYTSEAAMIWAVEIPCELPEGCTIGTGSDGERRIYDAKNRYCEIFDHNNHPHIWVGDKLVKLSISKKAITV